MKTVPCVITLVASFNAVFMASANVAFDWAVVGNPQNPNDPITGKGSVAREFLISTTEVTNVQYVEFLNAVASSDPNQLYNTSMGSSSVGGISRSGSPGSYVYATKPNMSNKPVNYVSWLDAARFVNWLHNGQGSTGTESGVYTITDGLAETRQTGAQFFLPTEDEWYKAAYHQPAVVGGDSDDYWLYPTATNDLPIIAAADATGSISNPGANVVNFNKGADWNGNDGNVTAVGSAGPGSASYYGTFDQGGNVAEWTESAQPSARVVRGGQWPRDENRLMSTFPTILAPIGEDNSVGFRVAAPIPEPGLTLLAALGVFVATSRRTA